MQGGILYHGECVGYYKIKLVSFGRYQRRPLTELKSTSKNLDIDNLRNCDVAINDRRKVDFSPIDEAELLNIYSFRVSSVCDYVSC